MNYSEPAIGSWSHIRAAAATFALFLTAAVSISAQAFQGAVYDTDMTSVPVNQNNYSSKLDVYMNGGPQNDNANGLPFGVYYFQVTDPNGATLLSTDPAICRQALVAPGPAGKGRVMGAWAGRPAFCSVNNYPADGFPFFTGAHVSGLPNPSNNSVGVQLMPFNDTPNNGGVYKLWLIRQTSNTTIVGDQNTSRILSFRMSDAKTDNFKVELSEPPPPPPPGVTYKLRGCKYYDRNANGVRDANEPPLAGVRIIVSLDGVEDAPIETGADGCWERTGVQPDTEFFIREILPLTGMEPSFYWRQTAPGEIAVDVGMGGIVLVRAHEGTTIGGTPVNDVVTIDGLDFGNICFGPNNTGRTLGYWSNRNGQAEMANGMVDTSVYPTFADNPIFLELGQGMNGNLSFLRRHNLKGDAIDIKAPVTVDFDPATYPQFKNWLLNGNAYNMSYMLSVQLAATSLNVRLRRFPDSQIVDASAICDSSGFCLGLTVIGNVRRLADQSLGNAGGNVTISGSPHRDSQELMKNFLDGVNNNRIPFAQNDPCPVVYPVDDLAPLTKKF